MQGCGSAATVHAEDGAYCLQCYEDVRALQAWEQRRQEKRQARELHQLLRRQEWKGRIRRAAAFVQKWSWIPLAILVVGGAVYMVVTYSVVWLQWKGWF